MAGRAYTPTKPFKIRRYSWKKDRGKDLDRDR
jgi:hypothetical protein